jgi:hypothetical protein
MSTLDSLQNYASQNQVICAKQNTFEQNLHNIKSFLRMSLLPIDMLDNLQCFLKLLILSAKRFKFRTNEK